MIFYMLVVKVEIFPSLPEDKSLTPVTADTIIADVLLVMVVLWD